MLVLLVAGYGVAMCWTLTLLAGTHLLWTGLGGRRVGTHPHCGVCGYDLVARSSSDNCPECGHDVFGRVAVTRGDRQRSLHAVAAGASALIVAIITFLAGAGIGPNLELQPAGLQQGSECGCKCSATIPRSSRKLKGLESRG